MYESYIVTFLMKFALFYSFSQNYSGTESENLRFLIPTYMLNSLVRQQYNWKVVSRFEEKSKYILRNRNKENWTVIM